MTARTSVQFVEAAVASSGSTRVSVQLTEAVIHSIGTARASVQFIEVVVLSNDPIVLDWGWKVG